MDLQFGWAAVKLGPPFLWGFFLGNVLVGYSFRDHPFVGNILTLYIQKSQDLNLLVSKNEGCWYFCLQGVVKILYNQV